MFRRFTQAARYRKNHALGQKDHRFDPPANDDHQMEDRLVMLKWHIERYDRLRTSTASRAAVVLSAGAILTAGNALILSQILGRSTGWATSRWWLPILTVAALISAGLVVSSLLRAANVLITARGSRDSFKGLGNVPVSLIFNGPDTLANIPTFADFRAIVAGQSAVDRREAAEVELWVCIHQHRHRYRQLRVAVRLLRYAAVAFFTILVIALLANLVYAVS